MILQIWKCPVCQATHATSTQFGVTHNFCAGSSIATTHTVMTMDDITPVRMFTSRVFLRFTYDEEPG